MAKYTLPAGVIKLCGEMSLVDSLWFLSEGRGALVQSSHLAMNQLHIQVWRCGLAGEGLLWPQTSCPLHHSRMDTTEMWYRKSTVEEPESTRSEMCLQCRFMLFWLCIYLFQASYSSRPLALELIVLHTVTSRPAPLLQPCSQFSSAIRMDDKTGVKYWLVQKPWDVNYSTFSSCSLSVK